MSLREPSNGGSQVLELPDTSLVDVPTTQVRLSSWLRAETRVEHLAVEGLLDLDRPLTAMHGAGLLSGWTAVWRDVRRAAAAPGASGTAATELLPMADQSLAWLATDRVATPTSAPGEPVDEYRTAQPGMGSWLTDTAAAWGVAYVLRGSRLGGTVLAPRIDAALFPVTGAGSAFFGTAGSDPGREWVAFRRRLDASGAYRPVAAAAARWTFSWVATALADAAGDRLAAYVR